MSDRAVFTRGQWATAAGAALWLHVLLAWALIEHGDLLRPAPDRDSGSSIQRLSLDAGEVPSLTDRAAGGNAPMAGDRGSVSDTTLYPLAPVSTGRMAEVDSVEPDLEPREKRARPTPRQLAVSKPPPVAPSPKARLDPAGAAASGRKGRGRSREVAQARAGGPGRHGADAQRTASPRAGNPRPQYPLMARRRGQEGRVLIRVSVLGDGRVASAAVANSSGHRALDQAALQAVKRWRFTPALRAGSPITTTVTVPVVFRLNG